MSFSINSLLDRSVSVELDNKKFLLYPSTSVYSPYDRRLLDEILTAKFCVYPSNKSVLENLLQVNPNLTYCLDPNKVFDVEKGAEGIITMNRSDDFVDECTFDNFHICCYNDKQCSISSSATASQTNFLFVHNDTVDLVGLEKLSKRHRPFTWAVIYLQTKSAMSDEQFKGHPKLSEREILQIYHKAKPNKTILITSKSSKFLQRKILDKLEAECKKEGVDFGKFVMIEEGQAYKE